MSNKKIIAAIVILVVIMAGLYMWREYNRTVTGLETVKADLSVEASSLIGEFMSNEPDAYERYRNKVLAVKGLVKQVDNAGGTVTVVMGDREGTDAVRCIIDSSYTREAVALPQGQPVTIKGAFTGFKKDETGLLGSDVEMNRCVIIKNDQ